jgi:transposase InsO family protein
VGARYQLHANPQRQPSAELIVHTDRGSQYASVTHRDLLARHSLQGSMSRKGNGWDNAVRERFLELSIFCLTERGQLSASIEAPESLRKIKQ